MSGVVDLLGNAFREQVRSFGVSLRAFGPRKLMKTGLRLGWEEEGRGEVDAAVEP
jgi:hypothetical protein